jgi:preprotein translocase subunit SecA
VRRRDDGTRLYATRAEKWAAVAAAIARETARGRPVLAGTRSVAASEELAAVLKGQGLAHVVLNARQDGDEAAIVARAGEPGRVTVATNMAGRGTDIRLAGEVAARGGLHVILTEYHESARIDRQLFGRCARQGDPGSCEAIASLEDELFARHARALAGSLGALAGAPGRPLPAWGARLLRAAAQRSAERANWHDRQATLEADRRLDAALAFTGTRE